MAETMAEFIEEIKVKVDLKSIVERRVNLINNGPDKYKGLSPLTDERTPSFFVDNTPGNRFWYCQSTKEGGGVIKYLELVEGMSKGEAIRYIAEEYDIKLPERENQKKDENADLKERMRACFMEAQRYFRANKQLALDYVVSRKYPEEIVDKYELGFAPDDWNALRDYLVAAGFEKDILIKCGMVSEKDGRTFSRYRNRLMFPIKDIYGKIIGFTGRTLDDVVGDKYLHVPNSVLFNRSTTLFNYSNARGEIKKQQRVFVTEGTFDAIIADHNGFPAVAVLGSEVSDLQLKILAGIAENIYMTFDSDEAGRRGMVNMFKKIDAARYNVITYAVVLGATKDVADFITKFGVEKFNALVGRALSDTSVIVDYYREMHFEPRMTNAALSKKVLADIVPLVRDMQYTYRSLDLIERTAQVLNMDKKALEKWISDGGKFTHNSTTYKKIDDITFPAEVYERRIMTECLKDQTKWSMLKEMGLSTMDFEYLPAKVLTVIENAENPGYTFLDLKKTLTEEEYHTVMTAYTQSFTEHLDIHTIGAIMVSRVKKRRGDARLSSVLGRPLRESKRTATKAIASLDKRRK